MQVPTNADFRSLSNVGTVLHERTLKPAKARSEESVQGKRADKKLARGEVPPLVLKIEGVVGPETAFAFLKLCLTS